MMQIYKIPACHPLSSAVFFRPCSLALLDLVPLSVSVVRGLPMEKDNIMRQAELNGITVGEKYKETASNMMVVEQAIRRSTGRMSWLMP